MDFHGLNKEACCELARNLAALKIAVGSLRDRYKKQSPILHLPSNSSMRTIFSHASTPSRITSIADNTPVSINPEVQGVQAPV